MSDYTLDQLAAGIRAAQQQGNTEMAIKLGRKYAELKQGGGGQTAPTQQQPEPQGVFSSLGTAFRANVDPILEGMGDTAEVLGAEGLGAALKGATSLPEGYVSSSDQFMNADKDGSFAWRHLPGAVGEQVGQFAGSVAARAIGAAGGATIGAAVAGPAGAAVGGAGGAFAGPAAFEAMQILGPVAKERAKNDGRTEVTWEDVRAAAGTAAASGALNALAPGAQGFVKRLLIEGATEGTQGLLEQIGSSAGTEAGLQVDGRAALAEGIIGAGSAGAFDATAAGVRKGAEVATNIPDKLSNIRYDKGPFTDDDARAAERLIAAADGDMTVLGNVGDTDAGSAKGAANAALRGLQGEAQIIARDLRKLAVAQGDRDAEVALEAMVRTTRHQGSTTPDSFHTDVKNAYDRLKVLGINNTDVERLGSLAHQINKIQSFTKGDKNDMGGLSAMTSRFDLTDPRSRTSLGGIAVAASGNISTLGLTTGANRVARLVDRLTNRRSKVKRYVESVQKSGIKPAEIQGENSRDALERLKALAQIEKASQGIQLDALKRQASGHTVGAAAGSSPLNQSKADAATAKAVAQQEAEAKKAEELARRYKVNAANVAPIFEAGKVPQNQDPMYRGYRLWEARIGKTGDDVVDALEQLEREGMAPKGAAQKYVEDPGWFSKNMETNDLIAMQEQVRQRINPEYQPKFDHLDNNGDTKVQDPDKADKALRKLSALSTGVNGDQASFKAREGKRRKQNLIAEIEAAEGGLSAEEFAGLYDLAEAIDSSEVVRADRFKMVNEFLPTILGNNPAKVEVWKKKFAPLAGIGNEKPYTRKPAEQEADEQKDANLEKAKKAAVKRKQGAKKPAANDNKQPEPKPTTPQTTADRALEKLKKSEQQTTPEQLSFDFDAVPVSEATKAQDAEEPQPTPKKRSVKSKQTQEPSIGPDPTQEASVTPEPEAQAESTKKRKLKLKDRVLDRVKHIQDTLDLARDWGDALDSYISELPKSAVGRVEGLIYEAGTSQITLNSLAESYANKFKIPVEQATVIVDDALKAMEAFKQVKRIQPYRNEKLKYDGNYAKTPDGKTLDVVQVEILDEKMAERLQIAQAVRFAEKMVPQDAPEIPYGPNNIGEGPFRALKDIDQSRIDASFRPIFDFLNAMNEAQFSISDTMLSQVEDALEKTDPKRVGTIGEVLLPVSEKTNRRDEGPLRTVAQLLHQLGVKGERATTLFRQAWTAGANLRVYSKNGLAHTQAGDIMKGLIRLPQKHKLGGKPGLNYVFHGIGNLLGFDKRSPAERREAIFTNNMVDDLVTFATDPFKRNLLRKEGKDGEVTSIGRMVKDGEGFFQVLNAAHEVKSMVDFAKARHPKLAKKLDNAALLKHPTVQKDLAENYETDFIVQLDASNNAYQIAGMVMGEADVLMATGLLPRPGVEGDPDSIVGADIYLEPARSIAQRIPEIAAMVNGPEPILSDSKLRKIFKGPIGTYLYAASFNSREDAFREVLTDIAYPAPLFDLGNGGLIPVGQEMMDALRSPEGALFVEPKYDIDGNERNPRTVKRRITTKTTKNGTTSYIVQTTDTGKFKEGGKRFKTEEEAMSYALEMDLFLRMNDELIRDMNTRYPQMREYLGFANTVANIVKGSGLESVKVPTIDGMMLEYSFKQNPVFAGVETTIDTTKGKKVVNVGVKTPDYKLAGRGLAAFMTHQLDAWALRETHRRLTEQGDLKGFQPIHDSYGFHPSDATRGQETWVNVMQDIGSEDFNLFLNILEANGISLQQFQEAGGNVNFIMNRKGVDRVPAKNIPTALS